MTTDPIKQDDPLNQILYDLWDTEPTEVSTDKVIPKAKAAILANYIPKQALAAALEDEPKTGDLEDDVYIVPARNELRAELRQQFGLEPKGV